MFDVHESEAATGLAYPEPSHPIAEGFMQRDHHRVYWHEYGNPGGEPVIFLHGGPGAGSKARHARFFNPRKYRVVMFDQRGCGRSEPRAQDDPRALDANTTLDLVGDIVALRAARGLAEPAHIFGGSWGSTLALAYAIQHTADIKTLILRGIFRSRKPDLDYFYQGNATTYPAGIDRPGTYLSYPEAWAPFVETIAQEKRGNMIQAYAEIFNATSHPRLEEAAKAWSVWEGATSYLSPGPNLADHEDPEFAKAFARLENHYFTHQAFFPSPDYLLDHAPDYAHLPIHIVQGRFDQVCPRFQADQLVAALRRAAPGRPPHYVVTTAGHSAFEPETARALTRIMDDL